MAMFLKIFRTGWPTKHAVAGGAPGCERVQLVQLSPISVGLMNGGYIEVVFMGFYIQQLIARGVPPCRLTVGFRVGYW